MIIRKKHATVATLLILVVLVVLIGLFLMREEPAPELMEAPMLTAHDIEASVLVSGETNEERQEHARAALMQHFTETGTGG